MTNYTYDVTRPGSSSRYLAQDVTLYKRMPAKALRNMLVHKLNYPANIVVDVWILNDKAQIVQIDSTFP